MKKASIFAALLCALLWALPMFGQSDTGELRLTVTDSAGLGLKSAVALVSEANQYRESLTTDEDGHLEIKRLPYGSYEIHVQREGFAEFSQTIEIHSAIPENLTVQLNVASVATSVTVSEAGTLVDPNQTTSVKEIGTQTIETRVNSLPGRSMQELVNSQPGWLFEGNAVLHPRGSEYQTQFVVDGIPLTDNRSPGFAPEIQADDVEDAKVYTAGYPAEFGRKLGGVIAIDTLGENPPGLHGHSVLSGGSYDTASAFTELQYSWKGNTLGVSGNGSMTQHYLNPVVPENFHNAGTTAGWSGSFERDLTSKDRLTMTVRHGLSRFQIPNEILQQIGAQVPTVDGTSTVFVPGGQRQDADNFETMGSVSFQHIFSANAIGWLRGMVRDKQKDLGSNPQSWPIIAFQHNEFKEGYFSGSLAIHHNRHELKLGVESDNIFLHENFSDTIPDCTDPGGAEDIAIPDCPLNPNTVAIFDPGTPLSFAFTGSRPNLEQSAYVQDAIHLGKWTVNAGLRWDHYQLIVNQNAVSPRVSVSRYFAKAGVVLHASYDRVFQTPDFENILLSSSAQVVSLNPSVLRLPVEPSHGNYYEAGLTKGFADKLRLDVNYFLRRQNNVADDDQILSTAVAFPIAWDHDIIYGAEAKVEVPKWWHFSGWVSYSYQVGNVFFPVKGGLFLGQDATKLPLTGHFPDTQDQRNTVRARVRYQIIPRLWIAVGADYGSGLPFDATLTQAQAVAIYGQRVVDHLNFDRGRVKPVLLENATIGVDLYQHKERELRLQADSANVSNTLDVIDFGGLFSGNAIGPARSYSVRLNMKF
jgi:hypothetical protein